MSLHRELRELLSAAEKAEMFPYGPLLKDEERKAAGEALVRLVGDPDRARTAWKLIVEDCGGYMPEVVGKALIHAANPNLVPDVEAPDPS